MPKVSVLIATYNEIPEFLEFCLESILQQAYSDYEIIIVDDGTDFLPSKKILQKYSSSQSKIQLWEKEHEGLTKSLNYGLSRCSGQYICRQDTDDWSEPLRIKILADFCDTHKEYALVGSNAYIHRQDGGLLWETDLPQCHNDIQKYFIKGNPFVHGAVMFRAQVAQLLGGYDESFLTSQDYDFFFRIQKLHKTTNLPLSLYHQRKTNRSITALRFTEQLYASVNVQNRAFFDAFGVTNNNRSYNDFDTRLLLYEKNGDNYLLAGGFGAAFKSYVYGVLRCPFYFRLYYKMLRAILVYMMPTSWTRYLFRQ